MTTATLADALVPMTPRGTVQQAPRSTDALGEEIAALAARLHAGNS